MNNSSGIPISRSNMDYKEPAPPGIYYHYTALDTLWAILETETLWATQARFSNDSEEIKKGVHILEELCSEKDDSLKKYSNWLRDRESEDLDCYIACFCGTDDILSQWRGYCRNDGVSIGFAFDETQPHYYFKDATNEEQNPQEIKIFSVWYVEEENKRYSSSNTISEERLKNELENKLKEQNELSRAGCKAFIDATIPLIKHAGFCEEDEYRLIIRNTQFAHAGKVPFPLDKYVRYSQTDGMKRPYVAISFGHNHPSACVKEVQLYGLKQAAEEELNCSLKALSAVGGGKQEYRLEHKNDWKGAPQIIIGQGENQQEVFESLDRILTANTQEGTGIFSGVKIWCDGHLPIRSIKVSPCQDQKDVIESIRHYCLHKKYWMKYVQVSGSDTPYRRPK